MICRSTIRLYFSACPHNTVCTQQPKAQFTNIACQLPASFYSFSAVSVTPTSINCHEEKKKKVLLTNCTIPHKTMATKCHKWRSWNIFMVYFRQTHFLFIIIFFQIIMYCCKISVQRCQNTELKVQQVGNLLGHVDFLSYRLFLRSLLAHTSSSGFVLRMYTL